MAEIDERALEAACREFKEHLYIPGTTSADERTAIKAAIESYEAARWRPIEEAPENARVLICLPDCDNTAWIAARADDSNWLFEDLDDGAELIHEKLIERGAMFRTIDPPTQDASQGAGDARQQPTEGKSSAS